MSRVEDHDRGASQPKNADEKKNSLNPPNLGKIIKNEAERKKAEVVLTKVAPKETKAVKGAADKVKVALGQKLPEALAKKVVNKEGKLALADASVLDSVNTGDQDAEALVSTQAALKSGVGLNDYLPANVSEVVVNGQAYKRGEKGMMAAFVDASGKPLSVSEIKTLKVKSLLNETDLSAKRARIDKAVAANPLEVDKEGDKDLDIGGGQFKESQVLTELSKRYGVDASVLHGAASGLPESVKENGPQYLQAMQTAAQNLASKGLTSTDSVVPPNTFGAGGSGGGMSLLDMFKMFQGTALYGKAGEPGSSDFPPSGSSNFNGAPQDVTKTKKMSEIVADNERRGLNNTADLSLDPRYAAKVDKACSQILPNKARYEKVAAKCNVPWELIGAIHYRESSLSFNKYLHNGDPLGRPTYRVPKGKMFNDWESSAIDAISEKGSIGQDADLSTITAYGEKYNGLGYRNKQRASPYALAGLQVKGKPFYEGGQYVRDHVYDANAYDKRPGVAAIVYRLKQMGGSSSAAMV